MAVSTAGGLIPNTAYTVVILFRFDQVTGFRRVFDATNGLIDQCSAYILDGRYEFEATNTSPTFLPNIYYQAVIVREAGGRVRAYRDGILRVNVASDQGCFQISITIFVFSKTTSNLTTRLLPETSLESDCLTRR